jgi:predicted sugar kinase
MQIEIGAPAVLPLGVARTQREGTTIPVALGVTLQHPPLHCQAEQFTELRIRGPRAQVARRLARRFLANSGLSATGEIQIENTIPAVVGMGADSIAGLTVAKALTWVHGGEFEDLSTLARHVEIAASESLAYWGFAEGGVMLTALEAGAGELPARLRRHPLKHRDNKAWVFVTYFPRVPLGTPDSLEVDRQAALPAVAAALPESSGQIIDEQLWPALENDDIVAFGAGLMALREMNERALSKETGWTELDEPSQIALQVMQDEGAVAWGQSLTGIGIYGLVEGAKASQEMRNALRRTLGYMAGQYSATITDNDGARHTLKEDGIHHGESGVIRTKRGVRGQRD